jgi:hypothetical protein
MTTATWDEGMSGTLVSSSSSISSLSSGRSSEWKRFSLLRERLSFLSRGIVARARKSFPGLTSTDSELKLFELKFTSSRATKVLRSLGSVQNSFDAISSLYKRGSSES